MSLLTALLPNVFPGTVTAQSTEEVPELAHDLAEIVDAPSTEEIVVTGQKRPENIQDVPISIAAFSGDTLRRANIATVHELGNLAPNFSAVKGVASSGLRLNIRGVGASGNSATEPSVAVFMDGVYLPRPGSIIGSFLDIESVEILRGPQGTLFGRNANAGALALQSAIPKHEFSAHATVEVGSFNRYKLDGVVNVPIGSDLSLRVAGQQTWFGGYWKNDFDGKTYGEQDDHSVRASLKVDLGKLSWIVRADFSTIKGDGIVNNDFDASSVSAGQLSALRIRLGGQLPDTDSGDRHMNQHVTGRLKDRQYGLMSNVSLDLGGGTLRLINSYRDWKTNQLDGDVVFLPLPLVSRVTGSRSKSDNHELQFLSPAGMWLNGHLDMVAGLYYYYEKYELGEKLQLNSQFCNVLTPAAFRPACNAYLAATGGTDATDQGVLQNTRSYAAYGQLNLKLADLLMLVLGGRYTKDKKSGSYSQAITTFNPVINAIIASSLRAPEVLTLPDTNDDEFTYRIGLNYEPTEDLLFFASYSTGYKSGGYNSGGGTPSLTTFEPGGVVVSTSRLFGPETVKNYELGLKSSWFDRKLTANITLFRMDINGFQDRSFDGVSFVIRNAGSLRQQGFEFDGSIKPTRRLKLSASLAYLDSNFIEFQDGSGLPGLPPGSVQNLTGTRANFSPKWSGRFGLDWSGRLGRSGLGWEITSNLSFVSDYRNSSVTDDNPQTIEDGYGLLGARVSLNGRDDHWSIALFGNNLTNTQFADGSFGQVLGSPLGLTNGVFPGSTAIRRTHGNPRVLGVSGTIRF